MQRVGKTILIWVVVVLMVIDQAAACRFFRRRCCSPCYYPCQPCGECAPQPCCSGESQQDRIIPGVYTEAPSDTETPESPPSLPTDETPKKPSGVWEPRPRAPIEDAPDRIETLAPEVPAGEPSIFEEPSDAKKTPDEAPPADLTPPADLPLDDTAPTDIPLPADLPDEVKPDDIPPPDEPTPDEKAEKLFEPPAEDEPKAGKGRAKHTSIAPEATPAVETETLGEMRLWTDNTGKYQTRGRLVAVIDGNIRLLKENGHYATFPMGRLSQADLAFVREQKAPSVIASR